MASVVFLSSRTRQTALTSLTKILRQKMVVDHLVDRLSEPLLSETLITLSPCSKETLVDILVRGIKKRELNHF